MLLPYCVFLTDLADVPQTGVEDRLVDQLDLAGLSVIYSDLGTNEVAGDKFEAAALKFHDMVHAVFEQRAVIPFRFPTLLAQEELRDHLQKESEHYLEFLRTHADDVQMEVRLWRVEAGRPKPAGGTEYMMRLSEHLMLLQSAACEVQRITAHLVREWKNDEGHDTVRLFALISRKHTDDFRARIAETIQRADIHMRVTGPWPATEFFPGSARRTSHNVASLTGGDRP
jgi:hypothetical protein